MVNTLFPFISLFSHPKYVILASFRLGLLPMIWSIISLVFITSTSVLTPYIRIPYVGTTALTATPIAISHSVQWPIRHSVYSLWSVYRVRSLLGYTLITL